MDNLASSFKQIILQTPWFETSFSKLAQAYAQQRLPHGIIIAAAQASGKKQAALSFIKSLLCHDSKVHLENACGHCKSCLLIKAGTHPDFYLLDRLIDNKGKQKKSIGIDQVRELTVKLAEMSQLGGWRVALITSISALTTASFNALLKTLEEPGKQTLLILLSDNLQTIPATVRSRCQLVQPDLQAETLISWLIEETQVDEKTAQLALKECFNAPLKAKDYLLNDGLKQQQAFYQRCDQLLLNQIAPHELIEQSELALSQVSNLLASYYFHVESAILLNKGLAQYQQLPKKLPFQLYAKILEFNRAQFAGSNLQANLQLQAILIQWFEAGRRILHLSDR